MSRRLCHVLLVTVDVEQGGKSFVDINRVRARHVKSPQMRSLPPVREQRDTSRSAYSFGQSRWWRNICDFDSDIADLQADELQLKRLGNEATLDWPGRQLAVVWTLFFQEISVTESSNVPVPTLTDRGHSSVLKSII